LTEEFERVEQQNTSHDISRSFIRAPQTYNPSILKKSPTRQENKFIQPQPQSQSQSYSNSKSNRFVETPQQKIPTMKHFLETKKIQRNSFQQQSQKTPQKTSPKAILISGGTEPSRIDQSQQVSRMILPNASCKKKLKNLIFIFLSPSKSR